MTGLQPSFVAPPAILGNPPELNTASGECTEVPFRLGFPGLNPQMSRCDIFALDRSASVEYHGGADPTGSRLEAAWQAFKTLARWADDDTLAAILQFDHPSMGDVPPGPVRRPQQLLALKQALRRPPDAIGTSMLSPSLNAAIELAEAHPEHHACLTVVSDFELFDGPDIFDRLRAFPGDVHAVIVGGMTPPELYGERITITEITPEDRPGILAAAFHRSLTATRPGRREGTIRLNTRPSIPPLSPGETHQNGGD